MRNALQPFSQSGAPRRRTSARRSPRDRGALTEHLEDRLLFAVSNAFSDFTTTANPNGRWTYGEVTNGTFAQDTTVTTGAWTGAGSTNMSSIGPSSTPQSLEMKPGQGGASADLRWTAAADGTYSVTGSFTDDTGNASDDVRVLLNGVSLVSGNVGTGGTHALPVNQNAVVVKAGDKIDFVVGPGSDGWDTADQVAVQAEVASSTTGTTNTSPLATTVTGKLPTKTLLAGQKVVPPFIQTVTLTNTGTTTVTGPVTINLVLGTTSTGEAGDPTLDTISRRVNLRAGKSMRFPLLVKSMPPNVSGDFFFVANVTDPTALTSSGASSGTITVEPPTVVLTGAFGNTPGHGRAGRNIMLPVMVSNAGNIPAKGSLEIDVVATSNNATIDLGPVIKRIAIQPAHRMQVLLVEALPGNMPAGTYTLNGTVDPNHVFNAPTFTNNTFTAPTPLVVS